MTKMIPYEAALTAWYSANRYMRFGECAQEARPMADRWLLARDAITSTQYLPAVGMAYRRCRSDGTRDEKIARGVELRDAGAKGCRDAAFIASEWGLTVEAATLEELAEQFAQIDCRQLFRVGQAAQAARGDYS